jgi:RNA-directed DNA polymerase
MRRTERQESEAHMSLGSETRQMSRQLELPFGGQGEATPKERSGEAQPATNESGRSGHDNQDLMALVVERNNVEAALRRVKSNKGSPGIDGMTVEELPRHLAKHWPLLREQLLTGTYLPKPVRRQAIPKSGGGVRELGIPTALDRFIQQCVLQVLQPRFDASFSQHSYGFRPARPVVWQGSPGNRGPYANQG